MPQKLVDNFGNPLSSKKPVTRNYRPIDNRMETAVRDLPPLSLMTIEAMRREPVIRMCLPIRKSPLLKMEFAFREGKDWKTGIRCDNPAVGEFVYRQLQRIWQTVSCLLDAQIYGWAGAEVVLKLNNDTGFLEVDELIGRHPRDVRLLLNDGVPVGVQFLRTIQQGAGVCPLGFPKAVFHAHFPDAGQWYGLSVLDGAYSPWWDKWMRGGGLDVRRLFMHKDAYGGADATYPQGESELPDGHTVSNKDIMREIVEQLQAGGVTTRPSEFDPVSGKELWTLTRATIPGNPQHILQYPKDLDDEMRHGMGIFDDIVTSDSTGSWDGKSMTVFAFLGTLDEWGILLLRDIKRCILDPLVTINFGEESFYEVTHKPFVEQLKDQQGENAAGQGGGLPGGMPGQRPFPGGIGGDGQNGDEENQGFPPEGDDGGDNSDDERVSDRMLKIAMSAIGRGAVAAQDVVKLSKRGRQKRRATDAVA